MLYANHENKVHDYQGIFRKGFANVTKGNICLIGQVVSMLGVRVITRRLKQVLTTTLRRLGLLLLADLSFDYSLTVQADGMAGYS